MPGLLLPVPSYTGLASWQTHINRGTPSSEPGTDLYVPIGTHLIAPADGVIWGSGESIGPATGRWVGINFDNGMSYRSMHHSRNRITSGRVKAGDVVAFSGASGYGEEDWSWNVAETGGAHVHVTLWPTWEHLYGYQYRGMPWTVDFMQYIDGAIAAGGSSPFDPNGENEMDAYEKAQLDQIYKANVRPYGYQLDALASIERTENQPRLDGIVARANASNTMLTAVIEMLKELDPKKSADIAAFEVKLRESEARTIAATEEAIQGSTDALRAEIVLALAGIEGNTLDGDVVTAAVDKALDRVFVRPV